MAITIEMLKRQIAANKMYRQCQLETYYDDHSLVEKVSEFTSLERLHTISDVTGYPVKVGSKNEDGSVATYVVEFEGCRFYADSGRWL